ncbi:MAG TPA: hypothetical protein VJN18_18715 [Polyangiaceae bacterium]|nr:hypothetical protein [Polyangiaceae bacterium]
MLRRDNAALRVNGCDRTVPHQAGRGSSHELLSIIVGMTHEGIVVYTKGALRRHAGQEHFYVFVSAKRSIAP